MVGGKLPDYGLISFGGVTLYRFSILNEPEEYFNYLQSNIAEKFFDPIFRFDQGPLTFKIEKSPVIEDMSQALTVPPVCWMTNVSLNQQVDVNSDWQITLNRPVSSGQWILKPVYAKAGSKPIIVEQSRPHKDTQIISSAVLQALQGNSLGNLYHLTFSETDFSVDTITVRGRGTSQTVSIDVDLVSYHFVESFYKFSHIIDD